MLLKLEAQGLNKIQIAEKLNAKTNEEIKKDADRIRKEIRTAQIFFVRTGIELPHYKASTTWLKKFSGDCHHTGKENLSFIDNL